MEFLKLVNLSKYYTSQSSVVMGLSNISLSFSVGEFVAITGESGSGKSTLAHVLGGILPYESGEMFINGEPSSHFDDKDREKYRRDTVGFISQSYDILEGNTVLENVESTLRFYGVNAEEARKRSEDVLREVDLFDLRRRRAGKLSSGQKQRLSIARALAKPSKILIADEPTGNLDRENSDKIISLLKKASQDRLVILVTHEFEEAQNAATRRLIINDGAVVSDTHLSNAIGNAQNADPTVKKEISKRTRTLLRAYTARLAIFSHPIFTAISCLLLAFTSFIVFAFLGTFTVAMDETSSRIYYPEVFYNGDPERLVVMKTSGEIFTDEDLDSILDLPYVESIEKWGYSNDVSYYYIPDTDYHSYNFIVNGPNYHPLLNPDDVQVTEAVKFTETNRYVRTVPKTNNTFISKGRAPIGFFEIVSADPDLKIGDKITVYVRNRREWSISSYVSFIFTVVGESRNGEGLYFSDKFAAMLTGASQFSTDTAKIQLAGENVMVAPIQSDGSEAKNEIVIPKKLAKKLKVGIGNVCSVYSAKAGECKVKINSVFEPEYTNLVLVSEELFDTLTDTSSPNQISVYIKDRAYSDRVSDALGDKGYLSLSPFVLGSTETDSKLEAERITTLAVCAAALILTAVLQLILLKALFSSLHSYFKLMANVGLTSRIAYGAISIMLIVYTAVGEILGIIAITAMNLLGIERITDIFKYLDPSAIVVLFAVHILSVLVASLAVLRSTKKAIFGNSRKSLDLDLSEMEDDTV